MYKIIYAEMLQHFSSILVFPEHGNNNSFLSENWDTKRFYQEKFYINLISIEKLAKWN